MTKTSIAYGQVDISSAHLLLSYTEECGGTDWEPIAVLSIEKAVEDLRVELLVSDVRFKPAIDQMQKVLHYYLHELNNPSPIGYLIHHCSTLSNVYGQLHFSFIERIDESNLFYYILTRAKLECIYKNFKAITLQRRYAELCIDHLFDLAFDRLNRNDEDSYNNELHFLYTILFCDLPKLEKFHLAYNKNFNEFEKAITKLNSLDFCSILNYLNKKKLVKTKENDNLLQFYNRNQKKQHFKN